MTTSTPLSATFGPLTIEYDERVLAPRPWTYAQSVWAADLIRDRNAASLLELCAGAGHIGLAAAVLAGCDLVQVELDPVAASFAERNAQRAGWSERVEVRVQRLQDAVPGQFEVIVADPPYLPSANVSRWPEDPVLAIDGGHDGLALLHACLDRAATQLAPGGVLLLQVAGPAQAARLHLPETLRAGEVRVTDPERAIMRIDHRAPR